MKHPNALVTCSDIFPCVTEVAYAFKPGKGRRPPLQILYIWLALYAMK